MRSTLLQLGTAALVIGGFVVLTLKGADTAAFVAMVTPVLGAVFIINHLDARSSETKERLSSQDEKLDQITHQTNGVLTERIKSAVSQALAEREGQ